MIRSQIIGNPSRAFCSHSSLSPCRFTPVSFTQSLKIVTTTLDMKQGQLGAGLHQLGGALETGLSEVDIIISISLRYLVDLFNECQIEILLNFNRNFCLLAFPSLYMLVQSLLGALLVVKMFLNIKR